MQTLSPALSALDAHRQFILYRAVPSRDRPGKTDKFPASAITGEVINAHDPQHWVDAATAYAIAPLFGDDYGVGFVITEAINIWCLDVDDCLTPANTWSDTALALCAALPQTAIEVSRSGRGLHIWGAGAIPPHGCKNTPLGLELYHTGRFIALGLPGGTGTIGDCSATIPAIVSQYFPLSTSPTIALDDWTEKPSSDWRGPADDDELIRRMLGSRQSTASAFGGRASIVDLWDCNESALAATYPDPSRADGCGYGRNEVDAALAQHLAWWTGRDMERMRRLMQQSALRRDKWDREDYLPRTIRRACSVCQSVYHERPTDAPGASVACASPTPDTTDGIPGPAAEPVTHSGRLSVGNTILSAADQIKLWRGFSYVTDANIILTATGQQLGPDQFKNRYGGALFVMDNENGKTSQNAWEAFTHSRATRMPKVDHLAFRPDLAPDAVWERDGESFVNSYRRLAIPRAVGDITPFLEHMARVLPIQRDRDILLAYMAAIVQHPGVKFQWAPIIQGAEGNGKTLFSRCVAEAVGMRYSHMPRASELAEKFNDWLVGKIFIGVEDVYYPEGRNEIIETLKPMITNSRLPIRAMRQSERTMEVCANFIINSNHKDAIRKTNNDRRWCVMFCAQQHAEHLVRDGMDDTYFARLYGWLNDGGYAAVSEYLHTYAIPAEFGLNCLLSRAPVTSSTEEAVACGLGRVEQEVQEAIASGAQGFANGWVSSLALDKLLKEQRMEAAMPRAKRADMLRALGYEHHPALRGGRLTYAPPELGGRPVLFIRRGSPMRELTKSAEIVAAYCKAQMVGAVEMMPVGSQEVAA